MTRRFRLAVMLSVSLLLFSLAAILTAPGCSSDQLSQWSAAHPKDAATTRAIDNLEKKIDGVAIATTQIAEHTRNVADAAGAAGVPYAPIVGAGASIVGLIAGWYLKHRKTAPQIEALNGTVTDYGTAFTQIVQGVDELFTQISPEIVKAFKEKMSNHPTNDVTDALVHVARAS